MTKDLELEHGPKYVRLFCPNLSHCCTNVVTVDYAFGILHTVRAPATTNGCRCTKGRAQEFLLWCRTRLGRVDGGKATCIPSKLFLHR